MEICEEEGCLNTELPDSKPASKPSKIPEFLMAKKNFMVEMTYQHHQVFFGWMNFMQFQRIFFSEMLAFAVWAPDLNVWKQQKILWKFDCEYSHLQGPVNVHRAMSFSPTARRSRRRRRPRSVMSLKVLVVFLVESKYHPESYHPSEIIKFTS